MRAVLSDTYRIFSRRGGRILGGAIAFYSLLSIAPLLLIAIHTAGVLTTEARARDALSSDLARWIGEGGARTLTAMLARAEGSRTFSIGSALSVALLVYASTRLFAALEFALHQMWGVQRKSGKGLKGKAAAQVRKRGLRFLMVLLCGGVLCALVALKTTLAAASDVIGGRLHVNALWHALELASSFVVTAALFLAIFRVLPEVKIAGQDVLVGAGVTAVLFTLGSSAIGVYIGRKGMDSTWGAAGSIVMLMLWVHYSAQIFFLGAAFTAARARAGGRPIEPNEHSVAVTVDEDS